MSLHIFFPGILLLAFQETFLISTFIDEIKKKKKGFFSIIYFPNENVEKQVIIENRKKYGASEYSIDKPGQNKLSFNTTSCFSRNFNEC